MKEEVSHRKFPTLTTLRVLKQMFLFSLSDDHLSLNAQLRASTGSLTFLKPSTKKSGRGPFEDRRYSDINQVTGQH